jgi:hypothetical protein
MYPAKRETLSLPQSKVKKRPRQTDVNRCFLYSKKKKHDPAPAENTPSSAPDHHKISLPFSPAKQALVEPKKSKKRGDNVTPPPAMSPTCVCSCSPQKCVDQFSTSQIPMLELSGNCHQRGYCKRNCRACSNSVSEPNYTACIPLENCIRTASNLKEVEIEPPSTTEHNKVANKAAETLIAVAAVAEPPQHTKLTPSCTTLVSNLALLVQETLPQARSANHVGHSEQVTPPDGKSHHPKKLPPMQVLDGVLDGDLFTANALFFYASLGMLWFSER